MIRVAYIEKESMVDGEGWRYVIFTQGCNHNCRGCHNPQTHDFNGGTLINIKDILEEIKLNPLLDGITLSGGDPFFQAKELLELVRECKKLNLTIWVYTGFMIEDLIYKTDSRVTDDMIQLLQEIDIIVDGKFILEERTLDSPYKGSKNQRIIDVQETLKRKEVVIHNL